VYLKECNYTNALHLRSAAVVFNKCETLMSAVREQVTGRHVKSQKPKPHVQSLCIRN